MPGGWLRAHRVPGLCGRRPPWHDAHNGLAGALVISSPGRSLACYPVATIYTMYMAA